MSVYTHIDQQTLSNFLGLFDLGSLVDFSGITAGIENSNYLVTTTQGEYVLTLFEHHAADEVQQFIALARHLGDHSDLPVPAPLPDKQGVWLHELEARPAVLCVRFPGKHLDNIGADHCQLIGAALADVHLTSQALSGHRPNNRGFDWWVSMQGSLCCQLDGDREALLRDEIAFQQLHRADWFGLPHGWIHGDLFRDNVLFVESASYEPKAPAQLGAMLDFYNACQDAWLFDLAIVANDWCCEEDGSWKPGLKEALLSGYQSRRALTADEQRLWPLALRGAALRFWLSRLLTQQLQARQNGPLALKKDPDEYRIKLERRRAESPTL